MEDRTDPENSQQAHPLWPPWQLAITANLALSALLFVMVLTGDSSRDLLLGAFLSVLAAGSAMAALVLAWNMTGRRARLATRLSIVPAAAAALLQTASAFLVPAPLATAEAPTHSAGNPAAIVLATIPLYPGPLSSDVFGQDLDGNSFRTVHISAKDSDIAAAWYRTELSTSQWSVITAARREKTDPAVFVYRGQKVVSNCIAARRNDGSGHSAIYYWTFLYDSVERGVTVVVQTPEAPVFSDCAELAVSSR